ncbi:30S ribosomal protein S6 [Candidatus Riesia pediculicola]|nr:30S ribosomal protein S6 [Candidatus Riesia pediculicola]
MFLKKICDRSEKNMNHYEIVLMIHPDKSNRIDKILTSLKNNVKEMSGTIHRLEDWGRRQLSYPIFKLHKAHYILINLEISKEFIQEIKDEFRSEESIIRNIVLKVNKPISKPSLMMNCKEVENGPKENVHEKSLKK